MTWLQHIMRVVRPLKFMLVGALIALVVSVLGNIVASVLFDIGRLKKKPEVKLEEQLASVFDALQENSRQATALLARLQSEVTDRNNAMQDIETKLQELRQQRALLELSPEQRRAIEGLVRRPQSLREMLTSLDFWVGQVAINAFFFALGVMTPWLARRRTPSGP